MERGEEVMEGDRNRL